jgi:hypothetical protein
VVDRIRVSKVEEEFAVEELSTGQEMSCRSAGAVDWLVDKLTWDKAGDVIPGLLPTNFVFAIGDIDRIVAMLLKSRISPFTRPPSASLPLVSPLITLPERDRA